MGKEKGKFDLVAASKKKKYKIILAVLVGLGAILLVIGFILRANVTETVLPNKLEINHLSGLEGNYLTISTDQTFVIDTGTGNKALLYPIEFKITGDARDFLEDVDPVYRGESLITFKIKPDLDASYNHRQGTIEITCGRSWSKIITVEYIYA